MPDLQKPSSAPDAPEKRTERVRVPGELITRNRQEFKQTVLDLVQQGVATIVADFSDTAYVDSSGLGVLVSCAKHCRLSGVRFGLVGLNEDLHQLIGTTKIDAFFDFVGDEDVTADDPRITPA